MLNLTDFLAALSEAERRGLRDAIGEGLHRARQAAQYLTDRGDRHATILDVVLPAPRTPDTAVGGASRRPNRAAG